MKPLRRLVSVVALTSAFAAPAFGADYKALAPLLVDLPGWQAEAANGMNMDMNGQMMVSAERSYENDDGKHIEASIVIGPVAALGMAMGAAGTMKIETDEGILEVVSMDGFTVTKQHDKTGGDSGSVIVHLRPEALFAVNYEGVPAADALAIAKRFNWKKLQSATK